MVFLDWRHLEAYFSESNLNFETRLSYFWTKIFHWRWSERKPKMARNAAWTEGFKMLKLFWKQIASYFFILKFSKISDFFIESSNLNDKIYFKILNPSLGCTEMVKAVTTRGRDRSWISIIVVIENESRPRERIGHSVPKMIDAHWETERSPAWWATSCSSQKMAQKCPNDRCIEVAHHPGPAKARNSVHVSTKNSEYIGGFRRHKVPEIRTVMRCQKKSTVLTAGSPTVGVRGQVTCPKVEAYQIATVAIWKVDLLFFPPILVKFRHAPNGMLGNFEKSKKNFEKKKFTWKHHF